MNTTTSPMVLRYQETLTTLPVGTILLLRLGDFYEIFGDDAAEAARILGATLTKRTGIPMCGVPYHALDSNARKLVGSGKRVALQDLRDQSLEFWTDPDPVESRAT